MSPPSYPLTLESPPDYTCAPLADERTVAHNRRRGHPNELGNYVRKWKHATLILKDQEEGCRTPTYTRGSAIEGEIGLSSADNIIEVCVKLGGQMTMSAAAVGTTGAVLLSERRVLWTRECKQDRCPTMLPFSLTFPLGYTDSGSDKTYKLPPTFDATFMSLPALYAKCVYSLTFTVTKTKRYSLASWVSSRTFATVVEYKPRLRPHRPIVMIDSIFDSIKPVPEEWQQHMITMEPKEGSNARPLECHLLIPSVQTYSISSPIPFHIQVRGPLASIREILPATSSLLDPATGCPKSKHQLDLSPTGPHAIRVYIARQVVVEVNGKKGFRTITIGTSVMRPVPPPVGHEGSTSEGEVCLDWQGRLKCEDADVATSFNAGMLAAKDFIVLALVPSNVRSSPQLQPAQMAYPIRLVTDSWEDLEAVHPQDI